MDKKSKGLRLSAKKLQTKEISKDGHIKQAPSFDVLQIKIADIKVKGKRRPLNKEKVRVLADSMKKIGLRTPLTVRKTNDGEIVLVAGLHRLAAAKSLGWKEVDCIVMKGGKIKRQLWAIAENLHRANLTKLQRADAINQWAKLVKELDEDVQVAQPGGKQPKDKGISKIAKKLNLTRETVRRSGEIGRILPPARAAAEAADLDKNERALLKIARERTPAAQVGKVAELAAKSKATSKGKKKSMSADDKKVLADLVKKWNDAANLKRAFNKASAKVRKAFIAKIRQG